MSSTLTAGAPPEPARSPRPAVQPRNRPAPGAHPSEGGPGFEPPKSPLLSRILKLRPVWPWIILAVLTGIGWHELMRIDLKNVGALLRSSGPDAIIAMLGMTGLNLAVAGLYDVAAFGPRRRPPSIGARWSIGVVSFAWSNFLTVGPLAGPALRIWLYRPMGVSWHRARAALSSLLASFSLALVSWCVATGVPLPATVDSLAVRLLLAAMLGGLTALVLQRLPRLSIAPAAVRDWEGNPAALSTVAIADWLLAWAVFQLALTAVHAGIPASLSLPAFFTGQLIGLVSFVPGGLGSADAFWILSLGAIAGGHDRVLAALLLYRVIYYIIPWACSTLYLAGHLLRTGWRTGSFVRAAIASYAFLCGIVLLASAATPDLYDRAVFLRRTVPLEVVELSHNLSVGLGFLLLVISRGLARGYRSSHRLALALFFAAALTTFLKGLDFEEAILALIAVALLLLFRLSFTRAGTMRPPTEFIATVGIFAVVLFAAVGFGSSERTPDIAQIFSRFGYFAYGERFLRALLLLIFLAAAVAYLLTQRSRTRDPLPTEDDLARALEDIHRFASNTNPLLVSAGDKAIFRSPQLAETEPGASPIPVGITDAAAPRPRRPPRRRVPEGFIAYRTAGRFLVAFSDPVCPAGSERDLLADFLEHATSLDRDVILYQISPSFLPVAHDFGFNFFKLGEEAIVDLSRFDLRGRKAKSWRHAVNSVEGAGGRFEIVGGEPLRQLLPELREVSDAWLAGRHMAELRFSIGRFDEGYLMRFPCAIVREASGRIAAFANVLEGPRGEELSVDLMRYRGGGEKDGGLKNIMEYLFLKLMLSGKERGFARFNLGMAPLSAVGEERWARPFERLAHLFFRHGDHWYNYQGLRAYKERFDPFWEPRYMAYPKPWDWPLAMVSTAALVAGGWRWLFLPRGEARGEEA